mmetsp:Transcript_173/g.359  ORF Transcript_173/g.359 Transcript_173/m.359 type:complete len:226 (-) Transcript_173:691-1368(-)
MAGTVLPKWCTYHRQLVARSAVRQRARARCQGEGVAGHVSQRGQVREEADAGGLYARHAAESVERAADMVRLLHQYTVGGHLHLPQRLSEPRAGHVRARCDHARPLVRHWMCPRRYIWRLSRPAYHEHEYELPTIVHGRVDLSWHISFHRSAQRAVPHCQYLALLLLSPRWPCCQPPKRQYATVHHQRERPRGSRCLAECIQRCHQPSSRCRSQLHHHHGCHLGR